MRWLAALPLYLLSAHAAPYPSVGDAPLLTVPVSPYTEDLTHWTPQRVREAVEVANLHLGKCAIRLVAGPLQSLPPGDVTQPQRLWRTDRPEELVVTLRSPGDARRYVMAGVATLRKQHGRWSGEAPWSDLVLALGQVVGGREMPSWPRPRDPDAMGKAKLALAWAVVKGWITLDGPTVAEGHRGFLRKRVAKLRAKTAQRIPKPRAWCTVGYRALKLKQPTQLLVADVPKRDAFAAVARDGDTWALITAHRCRTYLEARYPAIGEGLALVRVGGAALLLEQASTGVHARWLYFSPERGARAFRPPRRLVGCERVLAADALRPERGDEDPGTAVVVCPNRVLQLTPLPRHEERTDRIAHTDWATLTRRGPGRTRLLAGRAGKPWAYDLRLRAAPTPERPDPRVTSLVAARPLAPVWHAPGAAPIQLTDDALHGLADGPRPVGAGARAWFSPQLYAVARVRGQSARVDRLYEGTPAKTMKRHAGTLWAAQSGDFGPVLWTLSPYGRGWRLAPARAPRTATSKRARRKR